MHNSNLNKIAHAVITMHPAGYIIIVFCFKFIFKTDDYLKRIGCFQQKYSYKQNIRVRVRDRASGNTVKSIFEQV